MAQARKWGRYKTTGWTHAEDSAAIRMFNLGVSIDEIARNLSREPSEVKYRLLQMPTGKRVT